MVNSTNSKSDLEDQQLNYSTHNIGSRLEYGDNYGAEFTSCKLNIVSIFKRFQAASHVETITLSDEDLYISRYDGNEASPFLQINDIPSYIIMEKISEMQIKTVKNITEWANVEASSTPKRSVGSDAECSELDITGSPLPCPFQILEQPDLVLSFQDSDSFRNQKFPLKTYRGFSINKARSLASNLKLILKALKKNDVFLPPVWVVCDGKDHLKTMFLGVHVNEKGISICCLRSSEVFIGAEKLPTIDKINSYFALGSQKPRLSTKVEATYEVVSRKDGKSSSLDLCCRWAQPLSTLSSPGLDALTIANLHLELADEKSQARFLFLEFEILRNLIDGFKNKCLTWYQKRRDKKVTEALQDYFRNFSMKDEKSKGSRDSLNLDKIMEDKFLKMRPSVEFTDKIWDILKESESLAELSNGFKEIFKSISTGAIRPRIHVRNDTEFALICRDLVKGQDRAIALDKWQPIEMLIHIGLEKIKKDYVTVFQVCDLATTEQLALYTAWTAKTAPISECLSKLKKLQVVLQIVVILRSALNLPNSLLCHFISKTLLDLENKTDLPKDFEFQVDTPTVKSIVDTIVPSIWTYETSCKTEEENSGCSKWMKFSVKKDEDFLKVESEYEDEKDTCLSPTVRESSQGEEQTFYCLSVSSTGDIFS